MTNRGKVRVKRAIAVPISSAHLLGWGSEELADGLLDSIKSFNWNLVYEKLKRNLSENSLLFIVTISPNLFVF